MSYSSSGYLNVYAVILSILASPGAQRKTTIDAANGLTVMMVHGCNSCYGLDMLKGGHLVLHSLLPGDEACTLSC